MVRPGKSNSGTKYGVPWNGTSISGCASLYQEKRLSPPWNCTRRLELATCVQVPTRLDEYDWSLSAVDGCPVPLEIENGLLKAQRCPRIVKLFAAACWSS